VGAIHRGMKILELFAGIGGVAAAVAGRAPIVCAVDHDEAAHRTYRANWPHPAHRWNLAHVRARQLPPADLWWASPPCQPYTVRGARRDLDDPRAASLVRLLALLSEVRPAAFALENVPGFDGSRAHAALREVLDRCGYHVRERHLCPSELGWPNKRPRYYLIAALSPLPPPRGVVRRPLPLAAFLDPEPPDDVYVPPMLLARYADALPILALDHPEPQAYCFTGAYGRSPVYAGSYLRDGGGVRWFTPEEIARMLGFPATFRFPGGLDRARRWKLVGNSLSVPAVVEVLEPLLEGSEPSSD
jgi:site-specific DNA-cytosine methylase